MSPDPIAQRNAANAQFSTGPRTAEGKAVSSGNATVHGYCSVEPRTPEDRAEADALFSMMAAELKPITPMEIDAVRKAANADQKCRRLGRALEDTFEIAGDVRRDERKDQLAADRERCRAEVAFWQGLVDQPPEVGRGLDPADLQAVMGRFGAGSTPRRGDRDREEDPRANYIRFNQNRAQGGDSLREALANRDDLAAGESLSEADLRAIDRSRKACEALADEFRRALAAASERLAMATDREEKNRAKPERPGDWFDDSKRTQLLLRYQSEATRDFYRALRSLDAIRRRQDAERRAKEREERQAVKAAAQAARQAEIDARANPRRDELTARVVEPFVARSPQRNEPRSADSSTEVRNPNPVAPSQPTSNPTPEGPRVVHRRGRAVVIEARRPPDRR